MQLQLPRQRVLSLSRPVVMGILNVTPDSFSDGGRFTELERALSQVKQMQQQGAQIIDIGGESTRPGAADVDLNEELSRTIPVIEAIRRQDADVVISIDTSKTEVMRQAIMAGADIINDVRALADTGAMEFAATADVPVCIMHMQGQPRSMQHQPHYQQVTDEVLDWLLLRAEQCQRAGIKASNIILDPGFGFGKTLQHNYQLLTELHRFIATGFPVLAGMSRKSMIGQLLGVGPSDRLAGSLACATIAAMQGAQIIRVHDVKETAEAMQVVAATQFGVSQ